MQILQIASGDFFSTYGGGQVYVKNIVDEMIRRQCSLQVISFLSKESYIEKKKYKSIDLYEVGIKGIKDLRQLIEQIKPDIIHAHSHKSEVVSIGKKLSIPVVVTAHHGGIVCPAGTLLDFNDQICTHHVSHNNCLACCLRNIRSGKYWYPLMKLLPQKLYQQIGEGLSKLPFFPFVTPIGQIALLIARKEEDWKMIAGECTRMIAPCYSISEAMQRNGLAKDKIIILPHGIPLPTFVAPFPPIIDGRIKFFYVGRICYVKGIHVLLKAFSLVNNPHIELHLIGGAGNKTERRYEGLLKKKYAADLRIIWHGKIHPEQVFQTIQSFHILIHPTICLEIFGLNIAESLAMNKPVLATRCGGAEMQIEEGVNGWLVEPNNVEELAERIRKISEHFLHTKSNFFCDKVIPIQLHCKSLIKLYEEITH